MIKLLKLHWQHFNAGCDVAWAWLVFHAIALYATVLGWLHKRL